MKKILLFLLLFGCVSGKTISEKKLSSLEKDTSSLQKQTQEAQKTIEKTKEEIKIIKAKQPECNIEPIQENIISLDSQISLMNTSLNGLQKQTELVKDMTTLEIKACKKENKRLNYLLLFVVGFFISLKIISHKNL